MLSNAQFVVNRFQSIDQRLTDIANGLTSQIASSVNTVNSYAKQIAALNGNIKRLTALGQGQQPNDLIDQRDLLIGKVNQEIKTTALKNSDGTVSVYIGNGQPLVVDEQAMQLLTAQSPSDPGKVEVVYNNNGKTSALQQSSLQGGNLGAYFDFRDQSLEPSRNALGRVALGMAASINQQNQLGQDLNGASGGNLFNAVSPRVDRNTNNDPASGVPSVTIANIAGLTTSDYQLKFDGAKYTLLRLSDNVTTSYATLPQTVDGMTINAPVPVAAGDSFMIRTTANAARDIALVTNDAARIAAAAPMRTAAALTNSGTANISSGTVNAPPPADANLRNDVTITFIDSTHFTVTDNTAATVLVAAPGTLYDPNVGATLSFNGWTTQISGSPVVGDVFNVVANTNATGDSRNVLLMAGLQTQNLMANGTASLQGVYGQLVGDVGAKTQEFGLISQAQDNMLAQTVASQQAVSGVNLDEEAANLIRYQKAYQAAAKAMQIAQTMFDAILAMNS